MTSILKQKQHQLLVVAQWERKLITKTNLRLSIYVYYGSNRGSDETILAESDVIITTYNLVCYTLTKNEYKRGPLGTLQRIIFDKAHTIKECRFQPHKLV